MGDISKNFSYAEFEASRVAKEQGIENRIPDDKVKGAIKALVTDVLQPLRTAWGKPLEIRSGYRCARLNKIVGGVSTSQHKVGEAADISAQDPFALGLLALLLGLPFDQMILYPDFVHFSHKRFGKQRHQVLYNKSYDGEKYETIIYR